MVTKVEVAEKIDLAKFMVPVATKVLGPPNKKYTTDSELRWGSRGSLSVDVVKGVWHDHEHAVGGGVLDLIIRKVGGCKDKQAAIAWLRAEHFINGEPPANAEAPRRQAPLGTIVAKYDYHDEAGEVLFQVVRFDPKDFRQRRSDGKGGWIWSLADTRRVLYRLPRLIKAVKAGKHIYIPEGEKDVRRLHKLGCAATTNPMGANKWRDEYSEFLRGADCVLLPDNDDPGREHVAALAAKLHGIAESIRIVDLAQHWPEGAPEEGDDVSDWLDAGGTVERLAEIVAATPEAEPQPEPEQSDDAHVNQKQADLLISLAADAHVFHAADGTAYADLVVNDHRETWAIRSTGFRRWITLKYYEATASAPSPAPLSAALAVIEARAHFDGPTREVYVRIARVGEKVYLDLCNDDWAVVEIDSEGWRVLAEAPVRFCRRRRALPLPLPVRGGSVEDLRPFLNFRPDRNYDFTLLVAILLAALSGRGPYPVVVLLGEAGAAKSTTLRLVKAIVDPTTAPLRAPPREPRDLFIAANNAHVLAFDNLSYLPDWLSDTLCRLSTGGGFSTRQLYSDDEEQVFDAMRPVALNGIANVVVRGDLADRSIFLTAEAIPDDQRLPEAEFWAAFESQRAGILGALLDAVAHGLRQLPNTKLDGYPRMADFALWLTACEGALWPEGRFAAAYRANRSKANVDLLEADLVATAVTAFIATQHDRPWKGETGALLDQLNHHVSEDQQKSKHWPKASNALSTRLTRAAGALRQIGINVRSGRDSKTKRRIWVVTQKKQEQPTA